MTNFIKSNLLLKKNIFHLIVEFDSSHRAEVVDWIRCFYSQETSTNVHLVDVTGLDFNQGFEFHDIVHTWITKKSLIRNSYKKGASIHAKSSMLEILFSPESTKNYLTTILSSDKNGYDWFRPRLFYDCCNLCNHTCTQDECWDWNLLNLCKYLVPVLFLISLVVLVNGWVPMAQKLSLLISDCTYDVTILFGAPYLNTAFPIFIRFAWWNLYLFYFIYSKL